MYTVDEFEGDLPSEKNERNFLNLAEAKAFAREWYARRPNPKLKGDLKGGYHIDVFRKDTGFCFLSLG